MAKNKKWSAAAKFEIVLQVLKGESTLNEICKRVQRRMVPGGVQALFPEPNEYAEQAACCIPLLVTRHGDNKAQPGLDAGYYLFTYAKGFCVLGCHH